jgi:membrane protease YdiL (CAAX protease family)
MAFALNLATENQTIVIDAIVIVAILVYGTILARFIPRKAHISANLLAALATIVFGLFLGLSLSQMGLTLSGVKTIILISVAATGAIFLGTFAVSFLPFLRHIFLGESFANARVRTVFFEAGFRIPLGTALVEEILFRGVLLGMLLQSYSPLTSSIIAAIVFGLWHIAPSINSIESNTAVQERLRSKSLHAKGSVAGIVLVTFAAGFFFNWLRILSGTILTTWLVHWAINSSGAVASAMQGALHRKKLL